MTDSALAGLPGGAGFALVGVGLVLLYRVTGVVSFTQGAVGVYGALLFQRMTADGAPMVLALVTGLLASAAIAALIGMVVARWFLDASVIIKSAVTIGVAVTLGTLALRLFSGSTGVFPFLLPSANVSVGEVTIPGNTLLGVGLAVVVAGGLGAVVRWTRLGVMMRAVSERAPTAALLGVRVAVLNVGAWATSGALAAIALILIAPTRQADVATLSGVLAEAFAAALFASFTSLSLVVIGGLVIGIAEGIMLADSDLASYAQVIPIVVMVLVLLWRRRGEVWDEAR
ncbi:branched-chain amino acid ABC transporter permease [Streptomyces sp. NPDC048179]|uniref:branched-chain amino acid ABC transporter permease n=1 Tax=Streptomyces sp. NPDC048179 TaxID=3365506 RepID=UPI00370F93B3